MDNIIKHPNNNKYQILNLNFFTKEKLKIHDDNIINQLKFILQIIGFIKQPDKNQLKLSTKMNRKRVESVKKIIENIIIDDKKSIEQVCLYVHLLLFNRCSLYF